MAEFIAISEAKSRLSELVRESDADDVVLMKHGHPAAVMVSARRHADMQEQLDDLEDRLAVYEAKGEPTIPYEKLAAELGLG